jgi:hypothetical protein
VGEDEEGRRQCDGRGGESGESDRTQAMTESYRGDLYQELRRDLALACRPKYRILPCRRADDHGSWVRRPSRDVESGSKREAQLGMPEGRRR